MSSMHRVESQAWVLRPPSLQSNMLKKLPFNLAWMLVFVQRHAPLTDKAKEIQWAFPPFATLLNCCCVTYSIKIDFHSSAENLTCLISVDTTFHNIIHFNFWRTHVQSQLYIHKSQNNNVKFMLEDIRGGRSTNKHYSNVFSSILHPLA
jgi:hypothetical protein